MLKILDTLYLQSDTVPAAYFSRMRMCMRMCITVCVVARMLRMRICMFSLCMSLTSEFETLMKNTHTEKRIRD